MKNRNEATNLTLHKASVTDFVIGIDTGAKTGLAILDTHSKLIITETVHWSLPMVLRAIEDIRQRVGSTYGKDRFCIAVEFPGEFLYGKSANVKRALDVGKLVGRTESLCDMLEFDDYSVVRVRPKAGQTKWQASYVKKVYGLTRSNSHVRDAISTAEQGLGLVKRIKISGAYNPENGRQSRSKARG